MKVGINVKIDVTKIDKSRLYKGAKSRYCDWCDQKNFKWAHRVIPEGWLIEKGKRMEEQQKLEDTKTDVGWGHQIRSYVLDNSRIKDLRTGVEIGNTTAVLDGMLDPFIEASLKQGL